MTRRRLRCVHAALAVLLAWGPVAGAHTLSVSHVAVDDARGAEALGLELDLSIRDLALTLPLDANADDAVTWGELQAMRPRIEALVARGVRVSRGPGACVARPAGFGVRSYDDGTYAALAYRLECASTGVVAIEYALFFDRDPQHRALVTVRTGGRTAVAVATPTARIVSGEPSRAATFATFLAQGVHHILIGYDHLAFLLSLLLPAVLLRRQRRWVPQDGLRRVFVQVAGVVTAFTAAHTLTLCAAALGWVTPASRWVEAAIAASVLLAALNNLFPVVTRRVWVVAFGFGLVHGFGFAGALSELGLPADARILSLLAFNLGVEAGQLSVVAIALPLMYVARARRWYAGGVVPAASIAIAVLAAYWLFQRVAA